MSYQRQILLSSERVPRKLPIAISGCAHLAILVLILALRHAGPQMAPENREVVELVAGKTRIAYSPPEPAAGQPHAGPLEFPRSSRRKRTAPSPVGEEGTALAQTRRRAQVATSGMIASLKAKQYWGFSSEHYDLANQTAGRLPNISADEVPPKYEQYVMVEVTIDVDGRVADARIVSGEVSRAIQQKLLAAVHEFKYTPARRDGTPIPSQLDIVVHIPS